MSDIKELIYQKLSELANKQIDSLYESIHNHVLFGEPLNEGDVVDFAKYKKQTPKIPAKFVHRYAARMGNSSDNAHSYYNSKEHYTDVHSDQRDPHSPLNWDKAKSQLQKQNPEIKDEHIRHTLTDIHESYIDTLIEGMAMPKHEGSKEQYPEHKFYVVSTTESGGQKRSIKLHFTQKAHAENFREIAHMSGADVSDVQPLTQSARMESILEAKMPNDYMNDSDIEMLAQEYAKKATHAQLHDGIIKHALDTDDTDHPNYPKIGKLLQRAKELRAKSHPHEINESIKENFKPSDGEYVFKGRKFKTKGFPTERIALKYVKRNPEYSIIGGHENHVGVGHLSGGPVHVAKNEDEGEPWPKFNESSPLKKSLEEARFRRTIGPFGNIGRQKPSVRPIKKIDIDKGPEKVNPHQNLIDELNNYSDTIHKSSLPHNKHGILQSGHIQDVANGIKHLDMLGHDDLKHQVNDLDIEHKEKVLDIIKKHSRDLYSKLNESLNETKYNKHLALLNGKETHAYKMGGKWLVGGDYPQSGDRVSIVAKKFPTNELAWHQLKGSHLKFEDNASKEDIEKHNALNSMEESVENLNELQRIVVQIRNNGKVRRRKKICGKGRKLIGSHIGGSLGRCVQQNGQDKIRLRKAQQKRKRTLRRRSVGQKRRSNLKRQRSDRRRASLGLTHAGWQHKPKTLEAPKTPKPPRR